MGVALEGLIVLPLYTGFSERLLMGLAYRG